MKLPLVRPPISFTSSISFICMEKNYKSSSANYNGCGFCATLEQYNLLYIICTKVMKNFPLGPTHPPTTLTPPPLTLSSLSPVWVQHTVTPCITIVNVGCLLAGNGCSFKSRKIITTCTWLKSVSFCNYITKFLFKWASTTIGPITLKV